METSDSDYFESADEDISSDDEKINTIIENNKEQKKQLNEIEQNVKKLSVVGNTSTSGAKCRIDENLACGDSKKEELQEDTPECDLKEKNACCGDNNKTDDEKSKLPSESEKLDLTKENIPNSDEEINENKKLCESKDNSRAKVENELDEEENMWDEDELDWNEVESITKKPSQSAKQKETETHFDGGIKSEENMWEDDDNWEPIEDSSSKINDNKNDSNKSWSGWGNWGVTSILNTATQGVSTLTNHVSQGLTTVLETSMGIPDPDELARINKAEKEKIRETLTETKSESDTASNVPLRFGFGNIVSGVTQITKLVETTSNKVISGGLDTLETIGKKTMEVLQEGDPGLKKKRAFLKIDHDKPVLSQLLREAKEKAEEENKILEQKHFSRKANYETLFDDHQGLVHLEALEMLSKQCDIKLQTIIETLTGNALTEMQETMEQVRELCEIVEEDEEESSFDEIKEKLNGAVEEIGIPLSYDKLISTWTETDEWLENVNLNVCNEHELHQQAIETLAQLTAIAVEQFHKSGELLLIKEHRSTADEADSLVQLTTTLTSLIGIVAAKFTEKLNTLISKSSNKSDINNLITNIFYEAANSSSYIQDAFQLLLPVLQVGAV